MGLDDILTDLIKSVRELVPSSIQITQVELEGPIVVIYTKNLKEFATDSSLIKNLAQGLRRRVAVRPDPSLLADLDRAETEIKHIIPPDAEITDLSFASETGEVTIEARNPGLAIGKHGCHLNEIKSRIGWAPTVVRTPPIPCKTVKEIREYLRSVTEDRKSILRKTGRKIYRATGNGENWVRLTALGGFREVGRSCAMLSTKHSKVLIDCGVNVASDTASSPYLSLPEVLPLETIDAVVLTHAHLDHCGLVPLLYKYGYDGPVYATPPTRDMASLLQIDYLKVAAAEAKRIPYESSHVREQVKHTIPLRYGETTDISPDIRLTLFNAGHIIGSSVVHFNIADGFYNIAFTGDMKFENTWLFNRAQNQFPRLEALVMEATYGGKGDAQPSRKEAADQLAEVCRRTFRRRGKILIPVFAVGRSQEVILVLEELMRTGRIDKVPVYLDGMIMEATAIHSAYPEYLNNALRNKIFQQRDNPFLSEIFYNVDHREKREKVADDSEPSIVLATSGMMNGGPVMEYFKSYAPDERNTLIFVGYQAEGTLGRRLQKGWSEVLMNERGKQVMVKVAMEIVTVDGFSGHSDRRQLINYVHSMGHKPDRIILVHGDEGKTLEMASALHKRYGVETRAPMNLETIRFK